VRTAEWINLIAFSLFAMLAFVLPLRARQRMKAAVIGAGGIALTLTPVLALSRLPGINTSVIRDWLPAPLMLMVYWQVGCLLREPNPALQAALERFDLRITTIAERYRLNRAGAWMASYLETAYLLCYPLVPLGIGVLYLAGLQSRVEDYWRVVLPSTYLCYVVIPFAQTLPPRLLSSGRGEPPGAIRRLNLWLLERASIRVITFPSAHVAATVAASLALVRLAPVAGVIFLWISLSIAAGTVAGRYHFAADAITATVLATIVFLIELLFW
jgi:hypothetical protein